jgi:putative MATE family efflux protein
MKSNNAKLTQGKPSKAIISMMVPMVIGLIVMIGNGLVDAYFIGKLGYIQLAAVSYAFPVWFIVSGVVMGLGVGTSSLVARAIGSDDKKTVKEIATHSMILAVVSGSLLTFAGLSSIDFIFGLLGANEETMPYVREYMEVYFWGALFLAVPMIGNSVLRASGDAKTPSLLMASSAIINAILDPILIFGWFGAPALGVQGAALASVVANIMFLIASLSVLIFRDDLIQFRNQTIAAILHSWRKILHVGLPAIASNLIAPLSSALVTALVSSYGQAAVAAFGLAGRIEAFMIVIFMALGGAVAPYVGQNFGAKRFDRLTDGFKFCARLSLFYAIFCIIVFYAFSGPLLSFFTQEPEVIRIAKLQLTYTPWGYGFLGLVALCNGSFNAFGKPIPAMTISISRTLLVYVPMAYFLASIFGIKGVFIGQVISNILAAIVGVIWYKIIFRKLQSTAENTG